MGINYQVLTPPSVEPVSLSDMKLYLRVDYPDEDALIQDLITDARTYAEGITHRALSPQTIQATIEPDRAVEGRLSGPIVGDDFDVFRENERVDTIPFAFYGPVFSFPVTPASAISLIEYQLTPFDVPEWTTLPATDASGNANYRLDTNTDPNRLILMPLLVARRYRITYSAGYAVGSCPRKIQNGIKALVSFMYDNRQGEEIPDSITKHFARERVFTL